MKLFKYLTFLLSTLILAAAINVTAIADIFVVKKIEVSGLQRVSVDTFNTYLPVKTGETLTQEKSADVIKTLYKTGFFSDVNLSRTGDTLVIKVEERAVIGSINISGNKLITTKQLNESLHNVGFYEGQPFNVAILDSIKQALIQQYFNFGHYNVNVETSSTKMDRGRVGISIKVDEGAMAKIKDIKIVGNKAFSARKLRSNFSLETSKLWSFMTHTDQYSKEKLAADIESLRYFYLDNGYLKIKIDEPEVTFTPDKKAIYIVITVSEGDKYKLSGWKVAGDLIGKDNEINKLITLKDGSVFSRREVVMNSGRIARFLGDFGYAMPNVKTEPSIDDDSKTVFVTFDVDPGKRVYVRNITFSGNTKTQEYVLRREMRQQEGGLFSNSKVNESKRKLNNLGYLQDVDAKMEPVPGHPDQVDLNFNVKDTNSAGATLNAGYSDVDQFIFGASISESNFLGTGKGVGINFHESHYSTNISLNYFDPYFTDNNISMNLQVYGTKTKPGAINVSQYITNAYGFSSIFGAPLSDVSRVSFGYGYEHLQIDLSQYSAKYMRHFVNNYGDTFDTLRVMSGWNVNTLDRAIFPTNGFANSFAIEGGIPTGISQGDLQYYKLTEEAIYYHPMLQYFVLRLNADLGYGDGYGGMGDFPFFKNFYSGGLGSVRGYKTSSLGPRDENNNPTGGNVLADASAAIIFPNPFGETVRTSVFADAGNVFYDEFQVDEFRTSAGAQAEWRSPMGAVFTFSIAKTLNRKPGDRIESFQFNLGASI